MQKLSLPTKLIKVNSTWALGDIKFNFKCSTRYITSERSKRVRYRDCTREDKFHISKLPCITYSIYR